MCCPLFPSKPMANESVYFGILCRLKMSKSWWRLSLRRRDNPIDSPYTKRRANTFPVCWNMISHFKVFDRITRKIGGECLPFCGYKNMISQGRSKSFLLVLSLVISICLGVSISTMSFAWDFDPWISNSWLLQVGCLQLRKLSQKKTWQFFFPSINLQFFGACFGFSPWKIHMEPEKSPNWKGTSSSKPLLLSSILVFLFLFLFFWLVLLKCFFKRCIHTTQHLQDCIVTFVISWGGLPMLLFGFEPSLNKRFVPPKFPAFLIQKIMILV